MNERDEIARLKAQLADLTRQVSALRGPLGAGAAVPGFRTARISTIGESQVITEGDTTQLVEVYGIRFIDASFELEATSQVPDATTRSDTEYYAAAAVGMGLAVGALVGVERSNNRYWIVERYDGKSVRSDTSTTNPFNCLYPGYDVSSICEICTCTADPWVMQLPHIVCFAFEMGDTQALWLSEENTDETQCVWATESVVVGEDEDGEISLQWVLTIFEDFSAKIELIKTYGGDEPTTLILGIWEMDEYCCYCTNCFQAGCPPTLPLQCSGFPQAICLSPPAWGIARFIEDFQCGLMSQQCPDEIAEYWQLSYEGFENASIPGAPPNHCECYNGIRILINTCLTGIPVSNSAGPFFIEKGCTSGPWYTEYPGSSKQDNVGIGFGSEIGTLGNPDFYYDFGENYLYVILIMGFHNGSLFTGALRYGLYGIPLSEFTCTQRTELPFLDFVPADPGYGQPCAAWPDMVVLEPAQVLVDIAGDPIFLPDGRPVFRNSPFPDCDGNEAEVTCLDKPPFVGGHTTYLCTEDGWILCEGNPISQCAPRFECPSGSAEVGQFFHIWCSMVS